LFDILLIYIYFQVVASVPTKVCSFVKYYEHKLISLKIIMIVGMSGYTSVFLEQDGLLKVHLSLLYLGEDVTKENIRNGKELFCKLCKCLRIVCLT
jgi:hypothetical protein